MPLCVNLPPGSGVFGLRGAFAVLGPVTGLSLGREMGLIWAAPVGPKPC